MGETCHVVINVSIVLMGMEVVGDIQLILWRQSNFALHVIFDFSVLAYTVDVASILRSIVLNSDFNKAFKKLFVKLL